MADFERSTTVGVGADAAFAFLAEPERLPSWVPVMTLVEATAVEGELHVEAEVEGRQETGQARFVPDRSRRSLEWGRDGRDYSGSLVVEPGTASTCRVVLRLHLPDDRDPAATERVLDQAMRNLGRLLSGR